MLCNFQIDDESLKEKVEKLNILHNIKTEQKHLNFLNQKNFTPLDNKIITNQLNLLDKAQLLQASLIYLNKANQEQVSQQSTLKEQLARSIKKETLKKKINKCKDSFDDQLTTLRQEIMTSLKKT